MAASAVLLLSDLGSRVKTAAAPKAGRTMRVALLQHASQAILDQGREGMIKGLKEQGWELGRNLELKLYNAEGDNAVSQTIAKEMVGGGYDLLMTISTVSLQAVANANKAGGTPHVFALVSNPSVAGVGIDMAKPLEHPAHLAGFGTMQPIAQAFKIAREMNPALKKVGVVWNAAEANSEAQVKLARQVCAEMGIELMESTVDNSSGVAEAAGALVARGAEALWMGGDVTVMTAADSVISTAKKGGIPVFTVIPPNVKKGALFDLGADYSEVGRLAGTLAGEILNGRKPADVPITNVMPEMLAVNVQAAKDLKSPWKFRDEMVKNAQVVIDEGGAVKTKSTAAPNPSGKKWKIAIVNYIESGPSEDTMAGMKAAWKRSKLVEGKDYTISYRCAQGDIASLSGIFDAVLTENADIVVPMSTPALQSALQKVKDRPVVFSVIANPVVAGAGKSYTDHKPNVTGVSVLAPVGEALTMIQKYFPQYKRLGTLFCPAEANSVDLKESFEKLCKERGLTLECVAVNTSSDLADASLSLVSRPIDAVVQISDNLSSTGFNAISKAARQTQKPLISLNSTTVPLGAPVSMGRDYHNCGEATTEMIERVIRGEDVATMPFILPPKLFYSASPANAAAVGMTLPPELLKEVDKVIK
ncbi:ABC transporter substrate-binding protein [Prosthecobacter sp.]|uniref:ABC transporter substrate-binding protein n=1 Tax=Prosthecobacter sp. TaxID=1965333 RepID=UPI0037832419